MPRRGPNIHSKNMKLTTFVGVVAKWDEWSFSFKGSVKEVNLTTDEIMENVEVADEPIAERTRPDEQHTVSAKLKDVLCKMSSGKVLSVVRMSVSDCERVRPTRRRARA